VTLSVLEDARLTITSINHDGISTTREIADLTLPEDREIVQEFQVPPRLSVLQFTLKANVWNVSQNRKVELATAEVFRLNGIDRTDKIEDLHLTSFDGQYVLEVLGRTGEPRAHRPVRLTIKHRDFRQTVHVTLQADADGRVELGELPRVEQLTAVGPQEIPRTWLLRGDRQTRLSTMHAVEGTTFELPYSGSGDEPSREELSLLELRGDQFVADHFDALRRAPGTLKVAPLPRGDYDLLFKETGERIRFRIAAGSVRDQYVLGAKRHLELRGHDRLRIERVALTPDQLEIQLAPSGPFTRVHLFATRYEPAYWVHDHLGRIGDREPGWTQLGSRDSAYAAGRILGDEYRYIIDRKYAAKYPGIMLPRPSLLLNPWATSDTETTQQAPQEGEHFAPEAPAAESRPMGRAADRAEEVEQAQGTNLDFLAHASAVLVNLAPDEQGLLTIDRRQLAHHQRVWIVAVDPRDTVCRPVSLPESAREVVDLRLAQGFDPQQHFTQQKRVTVLDTGETLHLENAAAARFETYDSLAKVFGLMITLSQDATLAEFGFIGDWDQLTQEQKREKYSQYACHELNFFLFRKDPEFFQAVVLPYLRNKHHKTFLDDWLLGNDLRPYLEPWRHARLNVVEKILLGQRVDEEAPRAREYGRAPVRPDPGRPGPLPAIVRDGRPGERVAG
jgi:hypothetical protein